MSGWVKALQHGKNIKKNEQELEDGTKDGQG